MSDKTTLADALVSFLQAAASGQLPMEVRLHIRIPQAPPPPSPVVPAEPVKGTLTEREQSILDAVAEETLTGQEIADRLGVSFCGDFRATLSSLYKRGHLAKCTGGYMVARREP